MQGPLRHNYLIFIFFRRIPSHIPYLSLFPLFPELWKLWLIMTTFLYRNNSFESKSNYNIHFLNFFSGILHHCSSTDFRGSLRCQGWAHCLILFLTRSYLYCVLWPPWTSLVSYCLTSLIKVVKFSYTLTRGTRVKASTWWQCLILLCPFIFNLYIASLKSIFVKVSSENFLFSW